MSAQATRVASDTATIASDPASAVRAGNRALESIGRHEALRALLAFSELHEQIRRRRVAAQSVPEDLFQTERFVLDEVLQLICDRALEVTGAHGIMLALADSSAIVCRASSGTALIDRETKLRVDSEFLAECLVSGKILRCDDAESDPRVALDLVRQVGATSSVLVPLRGTHARLGVLQAFSRIPLGFNDNDVRCLDLFAELVLSALKPEDQDRRINWLSDLASEVLAPKPAVAKEVAIKEPVIEPAVVEEPVKLTVPALPAPEIPGTAAAKIPVVESVSPASDSADATPEIYGEAPTIISFAIASKPEIDEPGDSDTHWLPALIRSRPGWSAALGLVAVAALFSFGVWWGMRGPASQKAVRTAKSAVAEPSAPANDNLMDPTRFAPQEASTSAPNGKPFPKITGVRHWASAIGSTVVLDMDDQVPYEVHRLMSPERIYFDLHDTALAPSIDGQSIDVGDIALSRVRIAQPIPGVTRLVLDTRDGSNFSVSMETNPYRLVIELRPDNRTATANSHSAAQLATKSASLPAMVPTKPTDERLAAKTGKFRIVLDAGHGGWDLGTVGHQGLVEKDLVLDVTERLGKLLQGRLGVDVVFTRTTDDYLPLEQRADLANQAQADLFVSVHANYSNSANARGVETYYSNFFAAPGSKEIEKRENGGDVKPPTVSLSANALLEKIQESRHLAASVQRSLYATLAPKNPDIRDRGIKDAAFVVLTGTTMPAILTEISFVSSPEDEKNLQSETYREQIAEALYKGIARYEESAQHAKVAQLQPTSAGSR